MKTICTNEREGDARSRRSGRADCELERGLQAASSSETAERMETHAIQPCAMRSGQKPALRSPFSRFFYCFDV